MANTINIAGEKFCFLTVVSKSEKSSSSGALWDCVCDCGNKTTVASLKLRRGIIKSCGCRKSLGLANHKHGHSGLKTRTYRSWKEMRQRCMNEKSDKWEWYGGRGISVCKRWDEFENFLTDMGERPEGKTIDRIDSDGNYEPNNCRWATAKEQAVTNRGTFMPGCTPHNKII